MLRAELVEPVVLGICGTDGPLLQLSVVVETERSWSIEAIEKAVEGLTTAFPVLRCRYTRGFLADRWEEDATWYAKDAIRFEEVEETAFEERTAWYASEAIEIGRGWPFRVILLQTPQRSRLLLVYPHLLGDGNAGLTMMAELGAHLYGKGRQEVTPMVRDFWQWLWALRWRDLPTLAGELLRESLKPLWMFFLGSWGLRFARRSQGAEPPTSALLRISLRGEAYQGFVRRCKAAGATINDGLLAINAMIAARSVTSRWAAVAYTINLRRYLRQPGPIVANLSGVNFIPFAKSKASDFASILAVICKTTGEQKRRLPGVAFQLPAFFFGWLPHSWIRWMGVHLFRPLFRFQVKKFSVVTNIGDMAPYLEAFGEDACDAWMMGPLQNDFGAPIVTATGFRDALHLCVNAGTEIEEAERQKLADEWQALLSEVSQSHVPFDRSEGGL